MCAQDILQQHVAAAIPHKLLITAAPEAVGSVLSPAQYYRDWLPSVKLANHDDTAHKAGAILPAYTKNADALPVQKQSSVFQDLMSRSGVLEETSLLLTIPSQEHVPLLDLGTSSVAPEQSVNVSCSKSGESPSYIHGQVGNPGHLAARDPSQAESPHTDGSVDLATSLPAGLKLELGGTCQGGHNGDPLRPTTNSHAEKHTTAEIHMIASDLDVMHCEQIMLTNRGQDQSYSSGCAGQKEYISPVHAQGKHSELMNSELTQSGLAMEASTSDTQHPSTPEQQDVSIRRSMSAPCSPAPCSPIISDTVDRPDGHYPVPVDDRHGGLSPAQVIESPPEPATSYSITPFETVSDRSFYNSQQDHTSESGRKLRDSDNLDDDGSSSSSGPSGHPNCMSNESSCEATSYSLTGGKDGLCLRRSDQDASVSPAQDRTLTAISSGTSHSRDTPNLITQPQQKNPMQHHIPSSQPLQSPGCRQGNADERSASLTTALAAKHEDDDCPSYVEQCQACSASGRSPSTEVAASGADTAYSNQSTLLPNSGQHETQDKTRSLTVGRSKEQLDSPRVSVSYAGGDAVSGQKSMTSVVENPMYQDTVPRTHDTEHFLRCGAAEDETSLCESPNRCGLLHTNATQMEIRMYQVEPELNTKRNEQLQMWVQNLQAQLQQTKQLMAEIPSENDQEEQIVEMWTDVKEYAHYLGMDIEADSELLYIAKWAMEADLPIEWVANLDEDGREYFYNQLTGISQYSHPCDELYRQMYVDVKAQKCGTV
eukprot:jgi/Ulvmu1/8269/UM041_0080.1